MKVKLFESTAVEIKITGHEWDTNGDLTVFFEESEEINTLSQEENASDKLCDLGKTHLVVSAAESGSLYRKLKKAANASLTELVQDVEEFGAQEVISELMEFCEDPEKWAAIAAIAQTQIK